MESISRKPLQGVTNIVRFNWHYYVIAFGMITLSVILAQFVPSGLYTLILFVITLASAGMLISLAVSYYVYDATKLYELEWLDQLNIKEKQTLVNINAGFDETSALLAQKYPGSDLIVFDFYDPIKHTEISIERARKAYPAFPGTQTIATSSVPLNENSADHIFLILDAHEIRDHEERAGFFKQLKNALKEGGTISVVEHQRDLNNFLAYNFGFFHFHSPSTWKNTFNTAGLHLSKELKLNPFITHFTLTKHGDPS